MAEQCVISIEDSQQQPIASHDSSDIPLHHPASPVSRIESPTTCAAATTHRDDVDGGSAGEDENGSDGESTPSTTVCDHHSTPAGAGDVTPLSSAGADGGGDDGGTCKPYWLSTGEDDRQHPLLSLDSYGSDELDSLQRAEDDQQLVEVPAFLETPAVERMDEGEMGPGKLLLISDKLASAKPKRLSDEFFSADDDNDEDEEDEEEDDHGTLVGLCLSPTGANSVERPQREDVDCEAQASLSEIKNLSITCDENRHRHRSHDDDGDGEEKDHETADTQESNKEVEPKEDTPIPSGSMVHTELLSSCRVATGRDQPEDEQLRHHHHHHHHHHNNNNNGDDSDEDEGEDEELYLDDVQSMDAIERRDFEQEQRLTGGFLIRNRSLISADRLNLEFLNTINQASQQRSQPSSNGEDQEMAAAASSSEKQHTVEGRTTAQGEEGMRVTAKLNASEPAGSSSSCTSPKSTSFALSNRATAPLTTTPTSRRHQYKHDAHFHHHHHHHQHQLVRDGKTDGTGKQQQQVANGSGAGRDSFSSSYSRENENNSTTKSAVHKLTRNLSASLANCNEKRRDAHEVEAENGSGHDPAGDDHCDGVGEQKSTTEAGSTNASGSSSLSSLASSSNYSLYASASGSSGVGGSTIEQVGAVTEKEQPMGGSKLKQQQQLAEAFLHAITNNGLWSERSLFVARATETLLRTDDAVEELTADVPAETSGKKASSSASSNITAGAELLEQEENVTHDPCSTTSSTSYSSSSSPSPPQTQHSGDMPMTICITELPPTASLSGSTASSSSSSSGSSGSAPSPDDGRKPLTAKSSASTSPAALSDETVANVASKSGGVGLETATVPSSSRGRSKGREEGAGTSCPASLSCPFSKQESKQAPSTSSSVAGDEVMEGLVGGKTGTSAGQQAQHSQHHQHRRQYHHHHHHHHHRAAAGASSSSSGSSSASGSNAAPLAPSAGSVATRDVAIAPAVAPAAELALVAVAAPYHQQRDASTNTSNSPESSEPEIDEEDWADCEEGTDEEVCTCRDYTDEEGFASSEDELPSRDVDLSSYTHLDTIPDDLLHDTQTPRLHRKRKLTENRTVQPYGDNGGSPSTESLNYSSRKRLALDGSAAASSLTVVTAGGTSSIINGPSGGAGAGGGGSLALTSVTGAMMATTPRSSLRTSLNLATTPTSSTLGERKTPRTIIPTKDNPPPELNEWLLQFQRWTHVERLVAVDRLIEHCEPTQVRHMMKVIEPQFQRDFISLLPKELALQVLSYLEPKDLLRAAQTCRSWRFLADDNLLWKEKCKEGAIVIESATDRPKRGRTGNMPPISSPWKAAYMRQHIIEMNWRSRPIRTAKVLKGHDDHVITCLQFCGNRIVSGSDDNTLKVWSAITGKCLRTLTGHTGGVWSSQMAGNVIISGSTDRTLRVWNADTGQCMHILHGHTSTVRCMHLHGSKVVSGSRDATLRVWDVNLGTCLHMLVGHLAAVRCVQYDGKLIVSGAYDYMVKVWNPERQECLHTLQGHTNRVYSLQFDGVHVVSGSLDTSIRVWDAETGSCKHALMGHQSLTSGMELRQNILVSGNADSTVKVWDIITGQCLQTLSGPNKHQSAVTCLQFNSRFVITSSDDGTVKLWDVKTGDFIRNLVALESGGSGGVVWRIRANDTKLICAVGSRNGTEETKLMVLDFDVEGACLKCS